MTTPKLDIMLKAFPNIKIMALMYKGQNTTRAKQFPVKYKASGQLFGNTGVSKITMGIQDIIVPGRKHQNRRGYR